MSTAEVEETLQILRTTRLILTTSRLLEPVKIGREQRYPKDQVSLLAGTASDDEKRAANAPHAGEMAPNDSALIVRMGGPKWGEDEDPPRWLGWNETWDERTKQEAARQVWRVGNATEWIGLPLVPTVADWSVGAWRIVAAERIYKSEHAFEIKPEIELHERWRLRRIPLGRGPVGAISWPRPA